VAGVVEWAFRNWGWVVDVVDCMALLGRTSSSLGQAVFRRLEASTFFYDGLHFSSLRPGGRLAGAMERAATKRVVPQLAKLVKGDPPQVIVAVFATGVSAAARLKATGRTTSPLVVVCTDAQLHRLWIAEEADLYVVTSRAAAASVRRYSPLAAVEIVSPPVDPRFYELPSREQARRSLGVAEEVSCALLMGGGWGLGPLAAAARELATAGVYVLAVAGANRRLEAQLRSLEHAEMQVKVFGFTDLIPQLMAAADVVVTTPGAATCAEARVAGRPLVLIDAVPGHGRENLLHELELGGAEACGAEPLEIAASVLAALEKYRGNSALESSRTAVTPASWLAHWRRVLSRVGIEPAEQASEQL
jgi:processive 1,2-diacylglycerol beta-glucosyltransferase